MAWPLNFRRKEIRKLSIGLDLVTAVYLSCVVLSPAFHCNLLNNRWFLLKPKYIVNIC